MPDSERSLAAKRGWCTRKGHHTFKYYYTAWRYGKGYRVDRCERCSSVESSVPLSIDVAFTLEKVSEQMKDLVSERNPLYYELTRS